MKDRLINRLGVLSHEELLASAFKQEVEAELAEYTRVADGQAIARSCRQKMFQVLSGILH